MIQIKNTAIFKSLFVNKPHPTLIKVISWIEDRWPGIVITCGYEPRPGRTSVHSTNPLRGIDLRSRTFANPHAVADEINKHWAYDPKRPEKVVALFHDVGRGPHFHIQVHPNTQRIIHE